MANNVVPDPQPVTLETAAGVATGTTASPLRVDPTGTTTQPVSGTVTVTEPVSVDDNGGSLTVDGTVAATQSGTWTEANSAAIRTSVELIDDAIYTDGTGTPSKAIAVAGTDGTNPQILSTDTSGRLVVKLQGSTTLLADAQTNTITSTNNADGSPITIQVYPFIFNGTTWDRQRGDATNGALVNLGANNDVTVTGTVTEANSAAIAASLSVIDDWDETDRAKVNPIVGQAGVAAGSGAVSATTQRVTVATDDVVSVDDNGGSLTVDGTVAATQSGAWSITGDVTVVGKAADGAAVSGNPVLIGGQDGTNAQSILTDTIGRQVVVGAAAIGASIAGAPVMIGGTDAVGVARSMLLGADNADAVAVITNSVQRVAAEGYVYNGTTWDRLRGNATDGALVNLGANNDVTVTSIAAGDNNIGNVDVVTLPALPAGTNLIGAVAPGASATVGTGTSHFRNAAVTNTAVAIKASAGKLHGYNLYNPNASLAFVHFYDVAAASVTVGTTTPIRSVALPSTANGTIGIDREITLGVAFATAISVAASTTATGGTAPGTALVVNAEYI